MHQYNFDIFALHPPPNRLESLTSYLTRLANCNDIRFVSALATLIFEHDFFSGIKRMGRDYSPQSFGSLSTLAVCSESTLLQRTFFHLIKKFDPSVSSKRPESFLLSSLARTLRYCPICLAEHPFYSLAWRFLDLVGCPEHGCLLLDLCGHCGRVIPLLVSPLQIGICPTCKGDLRLCVSKILPESLVRQNSAFAQDLEYLLLPQPFETSINSISKQLGQTLTFLRRDKHLSFVNVIERAGIPERALSAMTQGKPGVTFQWYLKFARLLEINLCDLFNLTLKRQEESGLLVTGASGEEIILEQVQEAIMNLKSLRLIVTPKVVSEALHIPLFRLKEYPRVAKLFEQLTDEINGDYHEQAVLHERLFTEKILNAIQYLEESGKMVTCKAVGEVIGISPRTLKFYPKIRLLLKQRGFLSSQIRRRQHEDKLLVKVEQAIQQLKLSGQLITPLAVGKAVGIHVSTLKTYDRIRVVLEQLGDDYPMLQQAQVLDREKHLFERAKEALSKLSEQKSLVTKRAVARLIGIHENTITRYPRIKSLIEEHIKTSYYMQCVYRREEDLLIRVKSAVLHLHEHGNPVTYGAVAKALQVRTEVCRKYPQVRAFLDEQINQTSVPSISKRVQLSMIAEEALLIQVEKAIQQLISSEQLITRKSVSLIVGIPRNQFVLYPLVYALIGKHAEESRRQYRVKQRSQREEALLFSIEAALRTLREREAVITRRAIGEIIGMSVNKLNSYPRVKLLLDQNVERYTHLQIRQSKQHEQEIMKRVEEIAQFLSNRGLKVTQKAIGDILGENLYALKNRYPLLRQLLGQIADMYHKHIVESPLPEEDELLEKIVIARDELEALGQRVTREAIVRLVGVPRSLLKRYPQIEALLSGQREREMRRSEEGMLTQVERAIQRLKECKLTVTHRSIAKEVGLSPSTLHYYPRAIGLIQRIVKDEKQRVAMERFRTREQDLLSHVSKALQQLQQLEQPISASSIARIIGVDVSVLNYYPEVKHMVGIAVRAYKQVKEKKKNIA